MCEIVERQARRFTRERCTQMLDSFQKTVSDLEETRASLQALASPVQSTGKMPTPALGPDDAGVTIVEFCDFESSDCGRVSPMARAIENSGRGRVRFVFRQFPLSKNPHAHLAAEASLAANAQGRFWEYYEILFANPHDKSRAALERYAKVAGLALGPFTEALDDHRFAADVDADRELGRRALVESVPAVFVNGKRASVPYGVGELAYLLDGAVARR